MKVGSKFKLLLLLYITFILLLKTVAFIAGKNNPVVQKNFIRFSIEIKL